MNTASDIKLLMILLESNCLSVEEAMEILHIRELELELKKTSLGKELF
jgi:hypothetical protein